MIRVGHVDHGRTNATDLRYTDFAVGQIFLEDGIPLIGPWCRSTADKSQRLVAEGRLDDARDFQYVAASPRRSAVVLYLDEAGRQRDTTTSGRRAYPPPLGVILGCFEEV